MQDERPRRSDARERETQLRTRLKELHLNTELEKRRRSYPLLKGFRDAILRMAGISALNDKVNGLLEAVQRLEYFSNGARATYLGNNRVLVRIVVAGHNIAFIVEADDKLLSPWFIATGSYETDLTEYLVRTLAKDSHCLDVGANFGYFTCLMSRLCPQGKVIGVEADKHVFDLLRDNIAINSFVEVASARHAAIGDTDQPMTMYRRTGRSGNTSMAAVPDSFTQLLGEPPVTPFTVPGLRVDDLLADVGGRLDVMKVDVEGAEPLVFRGAKETMASNPQLTIVMEWSPNQIRHAGFNVADFLRELEAMGLTAFDLTQGRETAISFTDLAGLPYRAGVTLRAR